MVASLGDKDPSDTLVTPTTDESEDPPPWASAISEELPPGLRRRKKVKGYCVNSEDDRSGESDFPFSCSEAEDSQGCDTWEPPIPYDESPNTYPDSFEIRANTNAPSTISIILPSLLPSSYVVSDNISVSSGISLASSTFDTLTFHRELREAQLDSDFERVIVKLAHEWYYVGASVSTTFLISSVKCRLTRSFSYFPSQREKIFPKKGFWRSLTFLLRSVDTSVFGFSSSDLFAIDNFAKRALIISSIAAAIGLFVDVWFIFAYSGADVRKFQVRFPTIWSNTNNPNRDTVSRARSLRLVLLLLALITSAPRSALRLRTRARRVPRRHRMGSVARSRPRHVCPRWHTRQPTVHRVWMPPHRSWIRVDRAWGLAWRSVFCASHARGAWAWEGRARRSARGSGYYAGRRAPSWTLKKYGMM